MNSLIICMRQHPLHAAGVLIVLAQLVTVVLAVVFRRRELRAADAQPQNPNVQPSSGRPGRAGAKPKTTRKRKRKKDEWHLAAVLVAALAAACTAYSGNTPWRFAEQHMRMHSSHERGSSFFAGELALLACAHDTKQHALQERSRCAGVVASLFTTVPVIPASTVSPHSRVGTMRAFVGPVLVAMLRHIALGLNLWHAKPGALPDSTSPT
ncbi:hypothetical protein ACFYWP_36795 [Actinacidiphila glaucinigra]|uniref:hypothetical protein n=1 Tax=Actinacidiphila glaucinigra TaxID=235986 RepID=UPI00369BB06D